MLGHGLVSQSLDSWRGAGDVFAVQEDATWGKQVVDFLVQHSLPVVWQVMDSKAGHDGVERAAKTVLPGRGLQVRFHGRRSWPEVRQPLPGLL